VGWRTVKTDNSALGDTAKRSEPKMRMVFISRSPHIQTDMEFERKLFLIRKRSENEIRYGGMYEGGEFFYIASLSYKTLIYKGMLVSNQLKGYFPDLSDPDMESAMALVHSRFSTNTFPSWERAHPIDTSCITEINTCEATSIGCAPRKTILNQQSLARNQKSAANS
jgi:glutamate synthase (ferredoxin)